MMRLTAAGSVWFRRRQAYRFTGVVMYVGRLIHINPIVAMRTNIDIDDALLSRAMTAAELPTKKATVEEGLRLLVRVREQAEALAELAGLGSEGDLNEMRRSRMPRRT